MARNLWFLYVLFVVYGSFVPLEFQRIPLDEAVRRFSEMPWLKLGMAARADLMANFILYVPIGYGAAWFPARGKGPRGKCAACVGAVVFGAVLAVAVEFVQVFLPRTVSMNDLVAEFVGSVVGAVTAAGLGPWLAGLWRKAVAQRGAREALAAALVLYALAYVAYVLFPFDFLTRWAEIRVKWASGSVTLGLDCGIGWPLHVLVLKWIAQLLAAVPLGALVAWRRKERWSVGRALGGGLVLGLTIEIVQFFLASGCSQLASVVATALGFTAGVFVLQRWQGEVVLSLLVGAEPRVFLALCTGYALLLVWVNWAGRGALREPGEILDVLRSLSFLPFYYHYYMPESRALFSAAAYGALYAPVGGLVAWYGLLKNGHLRRIQAWPAAWIAGGLAFVCEAGKLLWAQARPDPTNVLLAAAAAWAGGRVFTWAVELPVRNGVPRLRS